MSARAEDTAYGWTIVPADPLAEAEGRAELIVQVQLPHDARPSIYDAFGKAKQPRTASGTILGH